MTTQTTTKDSFYLERLKTKFNSGEAYWSVGEASTLIWQPHTRNRFELLTETLCKFVHQKLYRLTLFE